MAFPATHAVSSSTTAHHAHGVKAHDQNDSADSFADLLAAADAAAQQDDDAQAATDMTAKPVPQATDAKASQPEDTEEDETPPAADPALIPASLPQQPAPPQTGAPAEKKDDGKAPDTKPEQAANDNAAALPPQLAVLLPPQQQPTPPAPGAATPRNNDGSAPLATGGISPAASAGVPQQPQAPAAQPAGDGDDAEVEAAATQQAAATPNTNAAASGATGDFKKTLVDVQSGPVTSTSAQPAPVKSTPAKAAPVAAKDDTTPAQNAAPHAGTSADAPGDVHAGNGQADARPADAAAQPPAPAHADSNPQPGMLSVAAAAPAPHGIAAQTAMPMPAQQAAVPMPHPQPNMQGLAVDIAAKSLGGAKQFDIRLDPPELGRVEVRLSIDASGKAQAHLTADQPQTLDLLQKDASSLTRALRDAGLNVAQDGLNFSLRSQQQQAGGDRQHQQSGGRAFRGNVAIPATLQPVAAAASTGRSGRGLLDIKV